MSQELKYKACRNPDCNISFPQYSSLKKYCSFGCEKKCEPPKPRKHYPKPKPKQRKPINRVSKINIYHTSDGQRLTKSVVDARIRKAKAEILAEQLEEHGFNFCEDCKENECTPVDCSHDISVDECQKSGRAELAWDKTNITLRGRRCHEKHG